MRVLFAAFATSSLLLLPLSTVAAVHPHHHTSTEAMVRHTSVSRSHHAEHVAADHFGSSMSSERATEIQSALIKNGYLAGTPSGTWDASSIAAMQKLQGDNGWQTKLIPDSRALIKLGLGPNSTPSAVAPAPGAVAIVEPPPAY